MQQLIIWSCGWRYGYKGCCPRLQWRFPKCGRIFSNIVGQFSHRNVLRATWYILHWTHHYLRWLNRNQARNRWNLKFWTSKASSDRVLDTVWPSGTSGVCKQHEDFHHNLRYCVNREPALIFLLQDLVLRTTGANSLHQTAKQLWSFCCWIWYFFSCPRVVAIVRLLTALIHFLVWQQNADEMMSAR